MDEPLLSVSNLSVSFRGRDGEQAAIEGISFDMAARESVAIVGESGSGKSVCSLAIMRLIPDPPGRVTAGSVRYRGQDLLLLPEAQMRRIRGNEIAMIFQEPMTSLNPVLTIGRQITEAVQLHQGCNAAGARRRAQEMLELVQIPAPEQRLDQYPHQLSGGMRQRVMIAMALSCDPRLLIADEPTTALDVTVQAQVLDLLREIRARSDTAILLITHDLGVVAEMAERVLVFYAGRVVEDAPVRDLLRKPRHPYTAGLLRAMPQLRRHNRSATDRLAEIPGSVPPPGARGSGCAFAPRCPLAEARCRAQAPVLAEQAERHLAACWRSAELQFVS